MGGSAALARAQTARLCALALASLAVLAILPALARAASYVAMGDSYSSGVGTHSYYAGGRGCKRSPHAYPVKVARRIGYALSFVACSGAKTGDALNNQLGPLNASTGRVTISIGGNDAGFSRVVSACALPWPWSCWGDIDNAQSFIRNTLPGRLNSVYSAIDRRSPTAVVAVVGYPQIFNGRDTCNAGLRITPREQAELNEAADLLARVTRRRAQAHGFAYVDPIPSFIGHAVCDSVAWVNGVSFSLRESFHPNRAGQDAYANLVTSAVDWRHTKGSQRLGSGTGG
jgi:lysophospholipase L1-like esterase